MEGGDGSSGRVKRWMGSVEEIPLLTLRIPNDGFGGSSAPTARSGTKLSCCFNVQAGCLRMRPT